MAAQRQPGGFPQPSYIPSEDLLYAAMYGGMSDEPLRDVTGGYGVGPGPDPMELLTLQAGDPQTAGALAQQRMRQAAAAPMYGLQQRGAMDLGRLQGDYQLYGGLQQMLGQSMNPWGQLFAGAANEPSPNWLMQSQPSNDAWMSVARMMMPQQQNPFMEALGPHIGPAFQNMDDDARQRMLESVAMMFATPQR